MHTVSRRKSPRASIAIAAHNEGDCILKTVQSCLQTTDGLDCEIVVADDASRDGSIEELRQRFSQVRVVGRRRRRGVSPTKDLAARESRGNVIVFLDGHCKPERGAIEQLVSDIEELDGQGIVTPRIPSLDAKRWRNSRNSVGLGFWMELERFECGWIGWEKMRIQGRFWASPALIGCCVAVRRDTYQKLKGFDPHMVHWGVEDLDFGLKAWLMGYPVLHDPCVAVGHRFRETFENYTVAPENLVVNQLRMARKNFTDPVWKGWLQRFRADQPRKLWKAAWTRFMRNSRSVEREREYLLSRRVHDEFWYARKFHLRWPKAKRP